MQAPKITPQEAKERIGKPGVVCIDVRPKESYAQGHIEGALSFPFDTVNESSVAQIIPAKHTQVIVSCEIGVLSEHISSALLDYGYRNVFNLGGIKSWPYKVVKG